MTKTSTVTTFKQLGVPLALRARKLGRILDHTPIPEHMDAYLAGLSEYEQVLENMQTLCREHREWLASGQGGRK